MAATAILLEKLISTIYNKLSKKTSENKGTNGVDEKNPDTKTKSHEIKIKNNYKIINKKIFDIIKKIDNNIQYYISGGGI